MSGDDYFKGMYEDRASKVVGVVVNIVSGIISTFMSFGILWYERYGSDSKRTILNKLVSVMYLDGLIWIFAIQIPEIYRYINGPIPSTICLFHIFLKNVLAIHLTLVTTVITFLRFMFIFVLKNPGKFPDDFWIILINLWIIGFATISQTVFHLQAGREPINYYLCSGIRPPPNDKQKFNVTVNCSILFSLIVQVAILCRIFVIYRKKHVKLSATIQQIVNKGPTVKLKNQSLGNFTMIFYHILGVAILAVLLQKASRIDPEKLNDYPNYWWIYSLHLFAPATSFCLLSLVTYLSHKHLPKTIFQEVKTYSSILRRKISTFFETV